MHLRKAFTLIELLVVIAIIAVLAVVVVLVLNPAGLLQESRDSSRISNMATLNSAINLFTADATVSSGLGSQNTLYLSVPDPSATSTAGDQCQGLGMPTLPSGWGYQCAPVSSYRKTDGTGWIPINFSHTTFGTPLTNLPIDPTNTTSSGLYYEYLTDGQHFEITSALESQKYLRSTASADGGIDPGRYEAGSSLALLPQAEGLVGLWAFNEGTGTIVNDSSGNGNGGTATGTLPYFVVPGVVGAYAGAFDGTDNYVSIPDPANGSLDFGTSTNFTLVAWVETSNVSATPFIIDKRHSFGGATAGYTFYLNTSGRPQLILGDNTTSTGSLGPSSGSSYADGNWHQYAIVVNRTANTATFFIDGAQIYSASLGTISNINSAQTLYLGTKGAGVNSLTGLMDDVRIYSRALSSVDVAALYNAE